MTAYLSVVQVLFVHSRLIAETGGSHGVRDLALLEAAVARPQATFDGSDLYPGVATKAAALMHSLVGNHPFVDGNKRIGIAAAGLFLVRNGGKLTATGLELEQFTMAVAEARIDLNDMVRWFEDHGRV